MYQPGQTSHCAWASKRASELWLLCAALLHLIPFCPHSGSQPARCAQWCLRARVKLLEFVPALQALDALCDLGQVAVGTEPQLSYLQNGNRGRNLLLQSQCRLGEMVLLASLCTNRCGHVHHPDTLPPFVPCSSFQLPVCQYILKLLALYHMWSGRLFLALTLLESCI